MNEISGDLFNPPAGTDAICIPTNGLFTRELKMVMGAGVAKTARNRWKGIDSQWGQALIDSGVHVAEFFTEDFTVVSFPTKINWKDKSSLDLIRRSAEELAYLIRKSEWSRVFIPKVGAGLGGLDWEDVEPVLKEIFEKMEVSERITVVEYDQNAA